jgi:hypothetical protein
VARLVQLLRIKAHTNAKREPSIDLGVVRRRNLATIIDLDLNHINTALNQLSK